MDAAAAEALCESDAPSSSSSSSASSSSATTTSAAAADDAAAEIAADADDVKRMSLRAHVNAFHKLPHVATRLTVIKSEAIRGHQTTWQLFPPGVHHNNNAPVSAASAAALLLNELLNCDVYVLSPHNNKEAQRVMGRDLPTCPHCKSNKCVTAKGWTDTCTYVYGLQRGAILLVYRYVCANTEAHENNSKITFSMSGHDAYELLPEAVKAMMPCMLINKFW